MMTTNSDALRIWYKEGQNNSAGILEEGGGYSGVTRRVRLKGGQTKIQ